VKETIVDEYKELVENPLARRSFLQRMSAAGLGVAAAGLFAGCGGSNSGGLPVPTAGPTPGGTPNGTPSPTGTPGGTPLPPGVDQTNFPGIAGSNINEVVLNYALALEILEADLYRQALNKASGRALSAPLEGSPSSYTLRISPGALNARSGQATADAFDFLRQFAFVEAAHRDFLRAAIRSLGGTPQPANPGGYKFPTPNGDPGGDLRTILANIIPLEETGVRAYLGAAGFLTNLGLLQTAATIFSTEARHSAVINDSIGRYPGPTPMPGDQRVVESYPSPDTFEYFLDPPVVLQRIRPYLA
jgi:hypothetical protein